VALNRVINMISGCTKQTEREFLQALRGVAQKFDGDLFPNEIESHKDESSTDECDSSESDIDDKKK
jgi:hypothetical protein